MKLADVIKMKSIESNVTWTSPSGPIGPDYQEIYYGLSVPPDDHPPSLKNPLITKIPTAQNGYRRGDSAADRRQAQADLMLIHQRLSRLFGKPELAQGALVPVFPATGTGATIR